MQASRLGGSAESDVTDVVVNPVRSLPAPKMTIPTPRANSRIAARDVFGGFRDERRPCGASKVVFDDRRVHCEPSVAEVV